MEYQFHQKSIPYLRTVTNEVQTQEQTQEVRLPDGMPDIGQVLSSWGQVVVRGKEWRAGGIGVNGGIMVWVLYAPEDGSQLQCIDTWLPFQMKWDFDGPAQDGAIEVMPYLQSVDARSTSARKMMVRAGVSMVAQARSNDSAEIGIPEDLPEDVCVLRKTYLMKLPAEGGEKAFSIEETLNIPASLSAPEKLIWYTLSPEVTDQKILTDKLIFRGTAVLRLMYLGIDGQLHHWSVEIPFSQFAELDRDYTDNAESSIIVVITNLELEKGSEESFFLKAGLLGQYVIYEQTDVTVVEDAYSPRRQVNLQISPLRMPAVLDTITETIHAQQPVEDMEVLTDVGFYPDAPRLFRDSDGISGEISGVFYMLGEGADGSMQGATKQWNGNWDMLADPGVKTEAALGPVSVSNGNGIVDADMEIHVRFLSDRELPMVTGLELGDLRETDPERPSLILRRKGNESLWDIAKDAGSTVEAIQNANGITQEPESEKMLLIPVQ